MLKTNIDTLPMISVQGEVTHPLLSLSGKMGVNGENMYLTGTGGIVYNAKIGDSATAWTADHLEPGVSIRNNAGPEQNAALTVYSCIGNRAVVVSGDAKGGVGFVTGKHGGCEDLICHFDSEVLERLNIGDRISVRAQGLGLRLEDYQQVAVRSMGPELLSRMNIREIDGRLHVGVAKLVPGRLMGSGIGEGASVNGDYDICLFDAALRDEYGLGGLRFGDIVAILDADTRYGRTYMSGAVTIGVVIHSDCRMPGHGPGVTTLMSALDGVLIPFLDAGANLAELFLTVVENEKN